MRCHLYKAQEDLINNSDMIVWKKNATNDLEVAWDFLLSLSVSHMSASLAHSRFLTLSTWVQRSNRKRWSASKQRKCCKYWWSSPCFFEWAVCQI